MNKKIRLMMLLFLLCYSINTIGYAENNGEFFDNFLDDSSLQHISEIHLERINQEPWKDRIRCFDVDERNYIAIGTKQGSDNYITIYDSDGYYQYAFRFENIYGFSICWRDENIVLFCSQIEFDVLFLIDPYGDILDVYEIQDEGMKTSNGVIFSKQREKTINGYTYSLEPNRGIRGLFYQLTSSYPKLIRADDQGNKTIIYTADSIFVKTEIPIAIWIIVIVLVLIIAIWINILIVGNKLKLEDLERYGIPVRESTKKLWKWERQGLENSINVNSIPTKKNPTYGITEKNVEYYFMGVLARSTYIIEGTLTSKEIIFREKSSPLTWERYEFEGLKEIYGNFMGKHLVLHDPRNRQLAPYEIGRRYLIVVNRLDNECSQEGCTLYQGAQIRCRLSENNQEIIDFLEIAGCRARFMKTRKEFIRRIEEVGLLRKSISG